MDFDFLIFLQYAFVIFVSLKCLEAALTTLRSKNLFGFQVDANNFNTVLVSPNHKPNVMCSLP